MCLLLFFGSCKHFWYLFTVFTKKKDCIKRHGDDKQRLKDIFGSEFIWCGSFYYWIIRLQAIVKFDVSIVLYALRTQLCNHTISSCFVALNHLKTDLFINNLWIFITFYLHWTQKLFSIDDFFLCSKCPTTWSCWMIYHCSHVRLIRCTLGLIHKRLTCNENSLIM